MSNLVGTSGVHLDLNRLQRASDPDCLELLKLALECLGVGLTKTEKIRSFSDAYNELKSCKSTADQSLPLLCAVLGEMSVPVKELDNLKKHTTVEATRECETRKDFGFTKMIIRLCGEFTEEEFATFRHLSLAYLDRTLNVSHFPTIVKLFQKLIQAQRVVWSESVEVLCKILSEMQKESSLKYVYEYKSKMGLFGTATSDQGELYILVSVCVHALYSGIKCIDSDYEFEGHSKHPPPSNVPHEDNNIIIFLCAYVEPL